MARQPQTPKGASPNYLKSFGFTLRYIHDASYPARGSRKILRLYGVVYAGTTMAAGWAAIVVLGILGSYIFMNFCVPVPLCPFTVI